MKTQNEKPKTKTFFYHYNKPLSRKCGYDILTVHFNNTCFPVRDIKCHVYTESRHRKTQPYCVIAGRASSVTIDDNECAIIT